MTLQEPAVSVRYEDLLQEDCFLGEVDRTLCCYQVLLIARAFSQRVSPQTEATFAIGHDSRASSPSLAEVVSLGLRCSGHSVSHIGLSTLPQLEWYIDHAGLQGGIMITGGYAPSQWNGLHLYGSGAEPVSAQEVLGVLASDSLDHLLARCCNPNIGHAHRFAFHGYTASLRRHLLPASPIKLSIDVGHGAAGAELDAVLAHYGSVRLWRLAFKPDPLLSDRGPDPFAPERQSRLGENVRRHGCHLGAALSTDGSVLAVVDERGQPMGPDAVGGVIALAFGGRLERCRVLHSPLVRNGVLRAMNNAGIETLAFAGPARTAYAALRDRRAQLYFDDAGHYAFSDFPSASNPLVALFELISHLSRVNSPLSSMSAALQS